MEKPNGFVFRVNESVNLFLLEGSEIVDRNSIPISDSESIYKDLKESQLMFVNVTFIDSEMNTIEVNMKEFDPESIGYSIHDLFSITIINKNSEEETSVLTIINSGEIVNIVKNVLEGQ